MKILKLIIKDPSNEIIRNIDFEEVGISFIYGDIQEPKNLGGTINSLGKTLLIKFIDYIYGANEDPKIVKNKIYKYVLEAVVKYNNIKYEVKRTLGNSEEIFINDKPYTLTNYKQFFNIKRSIYGKQLIINKKSNEISYHTNPNKVDISSEHILAIYEKTKLEVPELVKRKIEEVEAFHQKVYDERKELLKKV